MHLNKHKVVIVIFLFLIVIGLLIFLANKSRKPGYIKNIRRLFCTCKNIDNGIYEDSIIKWCTVPEFSNIKGCSIPGNYQDVTHPSIVVLSKPWHGYNIWLASTPYPQSLGDAAVIYENAFIYHANVKSYIFPTCFSSIKKNPVITKAEALYNSDPDLIFNDDTLYLITRKVNGPDYVSKIVMQQSVDGINWSKPSTLLKTNRQSLCPCVVKVGDIYYLYMFNTHFDERYSKKYGAIITDNIELWQSNSLSKPKFRFVKYIKWNNSSNVWHGDIVYFRNKFYMLYCGTNYDYKIFPSFINVIDTYKYLWIAVSDNGFDFKSFPKPLLKRSGIYRPTFNIDSNGIVSVYFSTENSYYDKNYKSYPGGNRIGLFQFNLYNLIKQNH